MFHPRVSFSNWTNFPLGKGFPFFGRTVFRGSAWDDSGGLARVAVAPLKTDSASTCSTRTSVELDFPDVNGKEGNVVVGVGRAGFNTDVWQ